MSYYSRQMALPEVGERGQQLLAQARCLVVGAGGLGCAALSYLAAAGIGTLGICDSDHVEIHNLHRQILYTTEDLHHPKAPAAAHRLQRLNPYITLCAHATRLTDSNCKELLSQYDLVLDCTDNFETKFLLNDASYFLKIPVIRASLHRFEGQLQFYTPLTSPCLRCIWPEIPSPDCIGSCAEVGVLGPLPGFFGVLQALEALKFFLGLPTLSPSLILTHDLLSHTQQQLTICHNPDCPLCGSHPTLTQISSHEPWELSLPHLSLSSFQLIDIREKDELLKHSLPHPFTHIPLSTFSATLDPHARYLFFCAHGRRSHTLVKKLREQGHTNVYSLIDGIHAFKDN